MTRERCSEGWAVDKLRMVDQIKPKHRRWTPGITGTINRDKYNSTVISPYDHQSLHLCCSKLGHFSNSMWASDFLSPSHKSFNALYNEHNPPTHDSYAYPHTHTTVIRYTRQRTFLDHTCNPHTIPSPSYPVVFHPLHIPLLPL